MSNCYWKKCLFCSSESHKSFRCQKRPKTKKGLIQALELIKTRMTNKKFNKTVEVKLIKTDDWTTCDEEAFIDDYTEVLGEMHETEDT